MTIRYSPSFVNVCGLTLERRTTRHKENTNLGVLQDPSPHLELLHGGKRQSNILKKMESWLMNQRISAPLYKRFKRILQQRKERTLCMTYTVHTSKTLYESPYQDSLNGTKRG